jgi:hypothetical protein
VKLEHGPLERGGPGEFVALTGESGLQIYLVSTDHDGKMTAAATKLSAPVASDYELIETILKAVPVKTCKKTISEWKEPGWSAL